MLWRALRHVADGFYIDVGAAHPDVDSVTRAFYERGWRGINLEPVAEYAQRLRAARPRDVTLCVAVSDHAGQADLLVMPGTGLSTLEADVAGVFASALPAPQRRPVALRTLAEICREHAPGEIHFLKIDAEGSERAVLAGCDFQAFRPWIIVIEATAPMSQKHNHQAWEELVVAAGYRFAWFDGLNRFYLAAERAGELGPHFTTPPNVFDDFLRAADSEWTRRISEAEAQAAAMRERIEAVESKAAGRLLAAERRVAATVMRAMSAEVQAAAVGERLARREHELGVRRQELASLHGRLQELELRAQDATAWLAATRASTSWRLTAPIRSVSQAIRPRDRGAAPINPPGEAGSPDPEDGRPGPERLPVTAAANAPAAMSGQAYRTIHQFHSGSAPADAITAAMLLTRRILRELGYRSDIFVEHLDPALAGELRPLAELPEHHEYVLLLGHSMGYDVFDRIVALPVPKVLFYHNITPPALLAGVPALQSYAELGRAQLGRLRSRVAAVLAASEFNATELRRLGFTDPIACTLLFDLDRMTRRPVAPRDPAQPFTVLFVGRVIDSKGQADLVAAFGHFAAAFAGAARLVLVGRVDAAGPYRQAIETAIQCHDLADRVTLTGLVSDTELEAHYAEADLYVSLSHHEGFGVPLVEAIARGVPVLAWPCGAVPFTLGETTASGGILTERDPQSVGERILALAEDASARAALHRRQRASLDRFRLDRQIPLLVQALIRAGATPPEPPQLRAVLAANLRFTIAGHINGSYSLAGINRDLALAIEAERPGAVRVIAVEGEITGAIDDVPASMRQEIAGLIGRPRHETGPHVVISQHYPVWVPTDPGDLALAAFFWEETVVPPETVALLAENFRGVLAPTEFVAKALLDSGLPIPVRAVGHAPDLASFAALANARPPRDAKIFTFLHVSSCFPRKGVDVLLAAYAKAFRVGDPVRLVIKGFPNPHNDVAEQLAALRAADPELAEIELIDRDISRDELLGLFAASDTVVLPTRGEGFNLPAAEAMAAAIPLIVTGFGGHLDFCNPGNARLLQYRLAPSGSHLASPLSAWAEPDRDDLAAALREAVATRRDPLQAAAWRARADRARADIAAAIASAAVLGRIAAAASDWLVAPRPGRPRLAWVSSWAVRCGVAEYSRHLLDALPTEMTPIILADSRTEPDCGAEKQAAGPPVRVAWRLGDEASLPDLFAALGGADPDCIVVQHQAGLMPWPMLARLLEGAASQDRIIVVALHNTRDLGDIGTADRVRVLHTLRACARVLVHTLADVNLLADLGLASNVALLPHGAMLPTRDRAVRTLRPEADAPLIGCYGFFLPGKGIGELIAAVATLRETWPRLRLRLVNANYGVPASTDEIASCRDMMARLGLQEEVEFVTEFLPNARSLGLLGECDLVVLPYQSSKEASSAAMRGALTADVPVAVTPLPLFDEAEDAVIRFGATDSQTLAAGIDAILADRTLREATRQAARRWLAPRDWKSVSRQLAGMLTGLRETAINRSSASNSAATQHCTGSSTSN